MKAKDLTGQRFGRLVVLRLADEPYISPSGNKTRRWICRCDCGKEVTVLRSQLVRGQTQSCGCLASDRRKTKLNLTGKRFGRWTVLHIADLPHPENNGTTRGWLCRCDCGTERVVTTRNLVNYQSRSCGCLLAEESSERMNFVNSMRCYQGTMLPMIRPDRPPNCNNTSGVKGVYWNRREKRWIAKIGFQGKAITLGRFKSLEDAAAARAEAEKKYFAPVLEQYEKEDIPQGWWSY